MFPTSKRRRKSITRRKRRPHDPMRIFRERPADPFLKAFFDSRVILRGGTCDDNEQAIASVAGGGGILHGVAGHNDSEYRGADRFRSAARDGAVDEGGAGELYAGPGGFYSD